MAEFPVKFTSIGGEEVERKLQAILKGATATSSEITRLSRSLKSSGADAAKFASNLGLSAKETANAVTKFRQLQKAGFSTADTFELMNKELKITKSQFDQLARGLDNADKQLDEFRQTQQASRQASSAQILALQEVNRAAGTLARTLGGLVATATKEFIAYEDALTTLAAKVPQTVDELGFLEEAVQEVALSTSQSPTSAVKAADALIALGASAQQAADRVGTVAQLTDALRTVGAEAEQSAKVIQLGTSIFEKYGETAQTVGDKIAYISDTSATASSTGLDEFLQVFSKAGGLSAQLGISLDELLANFAQLRDAGQAPEVAATSLKSLLAQSLKNRDALEELGIKVFEVGENGQESFVGLQELFKQIGERGTTTTKIVDLFGKIGVASAVELSTNYGKVQEKIDGLGDSFGALEEKSNAINSSIAGQIKLLEGSVQTLFVKLGEVGAEVTAPIVKGLLNIVNAFIEADPLLQKFVAGIVGIGAVLAGVTFAATSYVLALKALEAAQVGATIKAAALNAAQSTGIVTTKAAAGATTAYAVSLKGLAVALGTVTGALAAFGGALALADIVKTTGEIRRLTQDIEDLGRGNAATFSSALNVAQGLKNVNDEINRAKEQDLAISSELLEKQKQYVGLAGQSLDDIKAEIAVRQQMLEELLRSGEAQSDVAGTGKVNKEVAEATVGALQRQIAELKVAAGVLQRQVEASGLVTQATAETGDELEENNEQLSEGVELANKLSDRLGRIGTESTKAQAAAYAKLGDDKEALEQRLTEIEEQELAKRLKAQVNYLNQLKNTTFESAEEKKDAIAKTEDEIANLRLAINKNASDEIIEQQEAEAKAREEIEKERIKVEEESRKIAFDKEVQNFEVLKRAAEIAAEERIAAQEKIIESLDDESDAINQQIKLLKLRGERQDIIANQRLSQIDNEIGSLQEVQGLLQQLNDSETSINEKKLIREKLQKDGISLNATEAQISEAIRQKEEERRNVEFQALLRKQEQERISLALEQQQERIDLRRQLASAEIARIEAESLIVQTQLAIKAQERAIAFKELELAAKRLEGASASELIALQGEVDAEKAKLELQKTELPLAQRVLEIAQQQVDDARDAQKESEEIFTAQQQNLRLQQQSELQTTRESNREAAEDDRFERVREGVTDEDIRAGRQLAGSTRRASGGLPPAIATQPAIPVAQQIDTEAFALIDAEKELMDTRIANEAKISELELANVQAQADALKQLQQLQPYLSVAGARAAGGPVSAGLPYLVGEKRPELFVPKVPGTIVPRVPQIQSPSVNMARVEALLSQLVSRPVPQVASTANFYNQPNPIQTQVELLQSQLRASRTL